MPRAPRTDALAGYQRYSVVSFHLPLGIPVSVRSGAGRLREAIKSGSAMSQMHEVGGCPDPPTARLLKKLN